MDMKALAEKLLKLQPDRRRLAHLALCEYSLRTWHDYTSRRRKIRYAESVCGTWQKVDLRLPDDAFESALLTSPFKPASGLVEMQSWFARAPR